MKMFCLKCYKYKNFKKCCDFVDLIIILLYSTDCNKSNKIVILLQFKNEKLLHKPCK